MNSGGGDPFADSAGQPAMMCFFLHMSVLKTDPLDEESNSFCHFGRYVNIPGKLMSFYTMNG
jgi:hypothetical protein